MTIRRATTAKLREGKKEAYLQLHANPWPEVLAEMKAHHHHHHSVFIQGDRLFQYLEYSGEDFEKDMEEMRQNPIMQKWWKLCAECVETEENSDSGWRTIQEIFRNE